MSSRALQRMRRDRVHKGIKQVLRHLSEHTIEVEGMDDIQIDCNVWEINNALALKSHVQWLRSKITVLGEEASGKTSTVRSLLGEEFEPTHKPTFGINAIEARASLADPSQGWDRCGNGSEGRHIIKAAARLRGEEDAELNEKIRRLLYGSGAGGGDEQQLIKPFQLKKLTKWEMKGSRQIFTKAKKDYKRVEFGIWDFGGRGLFNPLHQDLLTDAGVYLVVFSLPDFIRTGQLGANLEFWLDSIHRSTKWSSVILVGTNLDSLEQPQQELGAVHNRIKELLPSTYPHSKHSNLCFFPVSNATGEGFTSLRREIAEAANEQELTYKPISTRWLRFLDLLTINEDRVSVDTDDIEEFGNNAEVYSSEITEMVDFFVELGLIVHLKSSVPCEQKVITKPWWLFEEIEKVVNVASVKQYNQDAIVAENLQDTWDTMRTKGVTNFEMMSYIWGKRNAPLLLELLRSLTLLCPWGNAFGLILGEEEVYFIPNLLHNRAPADLVGDNRRGLRCKIVFTDSFFPNGCFQRLVCHCVEFDLKEQDDERPELYADFAKLTMKDRVKLSIKHGEGDLTVQVDRADSELLENYSSMIVAMLRKLNDDAMNGALSWEVLYENSDGVFAPKRSRRKSSQGNGENIGSTLEQIEDAINNKEGVDLDKYMEDFL